MTAPRTLLKAWQLKPRKNMGQNFLTDPRVAGAIVSAAALSAEDTVAEIGAGLGALTIPAAGVARRVIAIEKDIRLAELLKTELAVCRFENVDILSRDVLTCDFTSMAPPRGLKVLGNLPYNISSQVVIRLIDQRRSIRTAVLMFQKELARRLAAAPGSKSYGRLSVLLQYCATIETVCLVPASAFYPRPKVDSMVIRIDFRKPPAGLRTDEKVLRRIVRAAFGRRRKTLRNSLAGGLGELDSEKAGRLLTEAGIDPRRRAETLSVAEFVALTNRFREDFGKRASGHCRQ